VVSGLCYLSAIKRIKVTGPGFHRTTAQAKGESEFRPPTGLRKDSAINDREGLPATNDDEPFSWQ